MRTRQGLETGRRADRDISRGEERRRRVTYDVGIDEARHDEFARFQVYEGIAPQAMTGDGVAQAYRVDFVVDPEDVSILSDSDQAPWEGEKACQ